jgi:GT2 family glycosyltransferase
MKVGLVAIGRNEGERLRRCLASLPAATAIVYVDSGSTDGSVTWARNCGFDVIELDSTLPFTAARARNVGFKYLLKRSDLDCVQFIDGDCELINGWLENGVAFLESHPDAGAVCGMRRERYPNLSVYNWLCDQEWNGPAGEVRHFGGDVLIRTSAFKSTTGYRDDFIAGEDPDLSVRMRAAGWHLWRLAAEMTLHDISMTRFSQWWRRAIRSGYVYAQGAYQRRSAAERYFVWESRRAWFWGFLLPLLLLTISISYEPWGWTIWLIYPLRVGQQIVRNTGSFKERTRGAIFAMTARFPESIGQLKFLYGALLGRRPHLIEYK